MRPHLCWCPCRRRRYHGRGLHKTRQGRLINKRVSFDDSWRLAYRGRRSGGGRWDVRRCLHQIKHSHHHQTQLEHRAFTTLSGFFRPRSKKRPVYRGGGLCGCCGGDCGVEGGRLGGGLGGVPGGPLRRKRRRTPRGHLHKFQRFKHSNHEFLFAYYWKVDG